MAGGKGGVGGVGFGAASGTGPGSGGGFWVMYISREREGSARVYILLPHSVP